MLGFQVEFGYFPSFVHGPLTTQTETEYISVKVYSLFYRHQVIEWSVPAKWGACMFEVYGSETGQSEWVKLTSAPTSANYFKDTRNQNYSEFNHSHYVVECRLPDGRRIKSEPVTWENKRGNWVELRAREIQRRETLILTKFVGIKSLIFRRRNFGKRCTACWNPVLEKITDDHCKTCLGTSFEGGYFTGMESLIQYEPTPNNPQWSYQGKMEANTIPAWTISKPEINTFDLVLRVPDWRLYRVEAFQTTELQTVTVRQLMELAELDKGMVEHRLIDSLLPEEYR